MERFLACTIRFRRASAAGSCGDVDESDELARLQEMSGRQSEILGQLRKLSKDVSLLFLNVLIIFFLLVPFISSFFLLDILFYMRLFLQFASGISCRIRVPVR